MKYGLLLLPCIVLFGVARGQGGWNSRADFSSTQGYHNWYYLEHDPNGTFSPLKFDGVEWVGSVKDLQIGKDLTLPGETVEAVRKWVAPSSMRIKITGTVNKTSPDGGGVAVTYTLDPTGDWQIPLWEQSIPESDVTKQHFDLCIWIEAGEPIYFYLGKSDDASSDMTDFNITITPVEVVDISRGAVSDHSNPDESGSIANSFLEHGSEKTYRLVDDDKPYVIDSKLVLPPKSSLINGSGSQFASIEMTPRGANASNYTDAMIILSDNSSISGLKVNANGASDEIVRAVDARYTRIDHCFLLNTRYDYSQSNSGARADIINMSSAQYSIVKDNVLRDAGYDEVAGGTIFRKNAKNVIDESEGALIFSERSNYTAFIHNDIANALTAGLTVGSSTHVLIDDNHIQNTDLHSLFCSDCEAGDGISGYHHYPNNLVCDYLVRNNEILNSRNHGIHMTGINVVLENNTIRGSGHFGIYFYDQRDVPENTPRVISYYCTLTGNNVAGSGRGDIYIDYACDQTFTISDNLVSTGRIDLGDHTTECSAIADEPEPGHPDTVTAQAGEETLFYPNPADNQINIQSPFTASGIQVNIANQDGLNVFQRDYTSSNPTIDVSELQPGTYYLSVTDGIKVYKARLLKN